MNILLYVSIAWVTLCVLFVGLDLIFLLIVERASDASQATGADEAARDVALARSAEQRHGLIQIKAQAELGKYYYFYLAYRLIRSGHFGRMMMAIQIVMDHAGDSRHPFNPNDARALAKAERRFQELTGLGFTAAIRTASGEISRVRSFDPTAEETLFFPRPVGG